MKKRFMEEDQRKVYGSPFWGSIDVSTTRMIVKEFILYKNEVLLELLEYQPKKGETDMDKIEFLCQESTAKVLYGYLVQMQLRMNVQEFIGPTSELRINVPHTIFYLPMNNLDTNWKYAYGQIAVHIGKPILRQFRSVSFFRNSENPKNINLIRMFLEDLVMNGQLGVQMVIHKEKFPDNQMEIIGAGRENKFLHILEYKNFIHFVQMEWESNKAFNQTIRSGERNFRELEYQQEMQYLMKRDNEEDRQMISSVLYRFKPCAGIQRMFNKQVIENQANPWMETSTVNKIQEEKQDEAPQLSQQQQVILSQQQQQQFSPPEMKVKLKRFDGEIGFMETCKSLSMVSPLSSSKKIEKPAIRKRDLGIREKQNIITGKDFLMDKCQIVSLAKKQFQVRNTSYNERISYSSSNPFVQLVRIQNVYLIQLRNGEIYMLNLKQTALFNQQLNYEEILLWQSSISDASKFTFEEQIFKFFGQLSQIQKQYVEDDHLYQEQSQEQGPTESQFDCLD